MRDNDKKSMIEIQLPKQVKNIINALQAKGYEAYAVGGCIRDSLLGKVPHDWDITTSALPAEVKSIFAHTIDTGIRHGTVTVMQHGEGYEVTTYRIDGEYEDGRHPRQVTFTRSLQEDLKRRDFTINAMAYNESDGLVDLFGGREDLGSGIIRAVGEARERFAEDALRMLRAVRFAAQLGFEVDRDTAEAITDLADTLSRISAERIRSELEKLLLSDHPEKLELCCRYGLTRVFLPQFDEAMTTEQNNPHHCYTVGRHIIESICHIRPQRSLRLTMLFHDLGKPACRTTDANGIDHFKGHPEISAQIAAAEMRNLKFDNAATGDVIALTRAHDIRIEPTEKSVRRLLAGLGERRFFMLLEVQEADILAQSMYERKEKLERLHQVRQLGEEIIAKKDCLSLRELAVKGADLMAMGYPKGPKIGRELGLLLERVIEEPSLNEREILLRMAAADAQQEANI